MPPAAGINLDIGAPDLSVVVPTCGRPALLRETLQSALRQSGISLEVIVVDDSKDGSAAAVVAELDDARLVYFKRETPSGRRPGLVRNDGWKKARAPVVHFLDDDDLIIDGAYQSGLEELARHPGVGLVFGRIEPFSDDRVLEAQERLQFDRSARRAARGQRLGPRQLLLVGLLQHGTLVHSSAMVRRSCVEAVGGFDVTMDLMEDIDFHVRVIRRFGARFIDRKMVRYRKGHPSLTSPDQVNGRTDQIGAQIRERYVREHGAAEFFLMRAAYRLAKPYIHGED